MKTKIKNISSVNKEISVSIDWKSLESDYQLEYNKVKISGKENEKQFITKAF